MKKAVDKKSKVRYVLLIIAVVFFIVLIIIPVTLSLFDSSKRGNVALIPITGPITADGAGYLGSPTVSSTEIVDFVKDAEENSQVKVIVLEINSPGGSAVASDEIASAVKNAKKPVVALIREVGASGGYWVASAADYIIANRMSITGSIGVISSYLEFSGLMDKYGVDYERLVAGKYKDMGTSFKELSDEENEILQGKLDKIHEFFISEIAANRKMDKEEVRKLATGEFYLGVEALQLGLIDQLGNADTVDKYIQKNYGLKKVDYIVYRRERSIFDLLSAVFSDFSFSFGEGFSSILIKKDNNLLLI